MPILLSLQFNAICGRPWFVAFDPHTCYLPGDVRGGCKINLLRPDAETGETFYQRFPDQFAPFDGIFGCNGRGEWPGCESGTGTLFRLPLRTGHVAAKSRIKVDQSPPTIKTVKEQVIKPFTDCVMQRLLFLKAIELIEVWVWEEGAAQMCLEGRWDIRGCTDDAAHDRKALMQHVIDTEKHIVKAHAQNHPEPLSTADRHRALLSELMKEVLSIPRCTYSVIVTHENMLSRARTLEVWVIASSFGGVTEIEAAIAAIDCNLTFLPYCAAACLVARGIQQLTSEIPQELPEEWIMEIDNTSGHPYYGNVRTGHTQWEHPAAQQHADVVWTAIGQGEGSDKEDGGRVFCCLPTPITTGLPIHVDGRWELSRDRAHMAYGSELSQAAEQTVVEKGEDLVRAEWNLRLACGVAATAYSNLLSVLASICADHQLALALLGGNESCCAVACMPSTLYHLLPRSPEHFLEPWSLMVATVFSLLSNTSDARWALVPNLSNMRIGHPSSGKPLRLLQLTTGEWSDHTNCWFNDYEQPALTSKVVAVLTEVGCPLTDAPISILRAFQMYSQGDDPLGTMTPFQCCEWLKKSTCAFDQSFTHDSVLVLLAFVMSDLTQNTCHRLDGVPLLPVTSMAGNTQVIRFEVSPNNGRAPIFMVETHQGGIRSASAHPELVAWLHTLQEIVFVAVPPDHVTAPLLAASGLVRIWSPLVFAQELKIAIENGLLAESQCHDDSMTFWCWQPEGSEAPNLAFLNQVWNFLDTSADETDRKEILECVESLPLIACRNSTGPCLVSVSSRHKVLTPPSIVQMKSAAIQEVFQMLTETLNAAFLEPGFEPRAFGKCDAASATFDPVAVLSLLSHSSTASKLEPLPRESKLALQLFLSSDTVALDKAVLQTLTSLPIFETIQGKMIPLTELSPRFMLPDFHSSTSIALGHTTILRRPQTGCEPLYRLLDIKPLPRAEHYAMAVMNKHSWTTMPAAERVQILDEVRVTFELMKSEKLSSHQTFAEFMCSAPLMWTNTEDEFFPVSEMIDPRLGTLVSVFFPHRLPPEILRTTLMPDEMPLSQYAAERKLNARTNSRLPFFETLGMCSTLSRCFVLKAAQQVHQSMEQSLHGQASDALLAEAKSIVAYIFHNIDELTDPSSDLSISVDEWLQQVKSLRICARFAAAPANIQEQLGDVPPLFLGGTLRSLVPFEGAHIPPFAVFETHSQIWSKRVCIRDHGLYVSKSSKIKLGIIASVDVRECVEHLKFVACLPAITYDQWCAGRGAGGYYQDETILGLLSAIYTTLDNATDSNPSISKIVRESLLGFPCVWHMEQQKWVSPQQAFNRISTDIEPFAYAMQNLHHSFASAFNLHSTFGIEASPNVATLAAWSKNLYDSTKLQPLNSTELASALKITKLASELKVQDTLGNMNHEIFVPDKDCILRPAHLDLFIDDAPYLKTDNKLRVDPTKVHLMHPKIEKSTGQSLGIRTLSSSVTEVMKSYDPLPPEKFPPNMEVTLAQWQSNLRSPEIQGALRQVAEHSQAQWLADGSSRRLPAGLALKLASLGSICIIPVQQLRSRYMIDDRDVTLCEDPVNNGLCSSVAQRNTHGGIPTVFLQMPKRGNNWSYIWKRALPICIDQYLGKVLNERSILSDLVMECASPHSFSTVLDLWQISSASLELRLGTVLPNDQVAQLVPVDPTNPPSVGSFVYFFTEASMYCCAKVEALLETELLLAIDPRHSTRTFAFNCLWELWRKADSSEPTEAIQKQKLEAEYEILCRDAVAAEELLQTLIQISETNEVRNGREVLQRFAVMLKQENTGDGPLLNVLMNLLDEIETASNASDHLQDSITGKKYKLLGSSCIGEVKKEGDTYRWTDQGENDWAGMKIEGTRLIGGPGGAWFDIIKKGNAVIELSCVGQHRWIWEGFKDLQPNDVKCKSQGCNFVAQPVGKNTHCCARCISSPNSHGPRCVKIPFAATTVPGGISVGISVSKNLIKLMELLRGCLTAMPGAIDPACDNKSGDQEVQRQEFCGFDPDFLKSEEEVIHHLEAQQEKVVLEEEPIGIDAFMLGSTGQRAEGLAAAIAEQEIVGTVTSVQERKGFDLVRVGNISDDAYGIQDIAYFHNRQGCLERNEITPEHILFIRQCIGVLRDVCLVFQYNSAFVTLFYEKDATSRFIKQKIMFNLYPIKHTAYGLLADVQCAGSLHAVHVMSHRM